MSLFLGCSGLLGPCSSFHWDVEPLLPVLVECGEWGAGIGAGPSLLAWKVE